MGENMPRTRLAALAALIGTTAASAPLAVPARHLHVAVVREQELLGVAQVVEHERRPGNVA